MALFSVTEGEYKPVKYPHISRAAGLVLVNRLGLLPCLAAWRDRLRQQANAARASAFA